MNTEGIDNQYALNVQGQEIYISDAKSGRKGYYCQGCRREMQAVIAKKASRLSYFRHDPKDVQIHGKCTYSDVVYRHKLAKENLQLNKRIKVPPLYKYPPKGVEGLANLIADSKFIYADSVEIECSFYEKEDGSICFEKNLNLGDNLLLFKPNVTFFDKDRNPILLIELVATHKIPEEKLLKIKRLGINTVQVLIPKDSPEAIAEALVKTNFTKWIYNYEQESTPYVSISQSHTTGISSADEIQRHLFEESYKCRASQINNLIRSITKCLGSECYRNIEQSIGNEISGIERNTSTHLNKWRGIQERRREELKSEYQEEISKCESNLKIARDTENAFQKDTRDLERRYKQKRSELESKIKRAGEVASRLLPNGEPIERAIERERGEIERIRTDRTELEGKVANFESDRELLSNENEKSERRSIEDFERIRTEKGADITRIQSDIEQLPIRFKHDKKSESELLAKLETQLRIESESRSQSIIGSIKNGEIGNYGNLSGTIKDFIKAIFLLDNISKIFSDRERNYNALQAIRSGSYKNWKTKG